MYVQNSNAHLYSASDDKLLTQGNKGSKEAAAKHVHLENFSEKATLIFEGMSSALSSEKREALTQSLNTIGKAAAFASMNGFESQNERIVVMQHFESLGGVISDEAIKKMIFSKLNNPAFEEREFFEKFARALEEPLAQINIRV